MRLIVKVDAARAPNPAEHVTRLLRAAMAPSARAEVEEVFPGLRAGRSAGLVSVRLPCVPGSKRHRDSVAALGADDAVTYVEEPPSRRRL